MGLQEFGMGILEEFIASIPQFMVLSLVVFNYLQKVAKNTDLFPNLLEDTKKGMDTDFKKTQEALMQSWDTIQGDMKQIVSNITKEIESAVVDRMEGMERELSRYQDQLRRMKNQTNALTKQNKVYMDILNVLLAQDPEKVRSGVASVISSTINWTQDEIMNNPEVILEDLPRLKLAIQEAKAILGEEKFDEMMGAIDDERKEL